MLHLEPELCVMITKPMIKVSVFHCIFFYDFEMKVRQELRNYKLCLHKTLLKSFCVSKIFVRAHKHVLPLKFYIGESDFTSILLATLITAGKGHMMLEFSVR